MAEAIRLTTWPRLRFRPNRVHIVHRRLFGRTACGLLIAGRAWVWDSSLDEWPDPCAKCLKTGKKGEVQ